ncbi:hypothetical protein ILUMI_00742 [Ignelater luminosus]|uniref:Uncharacterized protein n=1 Tax=Ignelater luminosus TaxID=2038154 RepID=A0A8K0DLP2_IGNLU|nr:hypothetical protein ILUMI_00742 [Ignelater luminosus]
MYNIGLLTLTFFCSFFIVFSLIMVIFMIVILVCVKPTPKPTVKTRSRSELSDRRVNDFIRSVLIEDDCQYDVLKGNSSDMQYNNRYDMLSSMITTSTPYSQQNMYEYVDPKAYYDPKRT